MTELKELLADLAKDLNSGDVEISTAIIILRILSQGSGPAITSNDLAWAKEKLEKDTLRGKP